MTCPGSDLPESTICVMSADAAAIQQGLKPGARAVIVGGGYIGLEIAATARHMGCAVTVLEMADRVMNRVVASNVSEYFEHEHRTQGVKIICNSRVVRLEGSGRVERVVCADGSMYPADLLVVGVGAIANAQLAADAGIKCDNGIVVDENLPHQRPRNFRGGRLHQLFFAALPNPGAARVGGQCFRAKQGGGAQHFRAAGCLRPGPLVLVGSVRQQAADCRGVTGPRPAIDARRSGDPQFQRLLLKGGELLAVEAINHSKDYMAARKLIAERFRPDLDKLADPQ